VSPRRANSLGDFYRSEVMFYRELPERALIARRGDAPKIDDQSRFLLLLRGLAPGPGRHTDRRLHPGGRRAGGWPSARFASRAYWADDSLAERDWMYVPDAESGFYTKESVDRSWTHVREITRADYPPGSATCVPAKSPRTSSGTGARQADADPTTTSDGTNMLYATMERRIAMARLADGELPGAGGRRLLSRALDRDTRSSAGAGMLHRITTNFRATG